jgi:hypothetical protein
MQFLDVAKAKSAHAGMHSAEAASVASVKSGLCMGNTSSKLVKCLASLARVQGVFVFYAWRWRYALARHVAVWLWAIICALF